MSIIFSKSVQSIQDWCTTIRLPEYNHVLFEAGYEDTTFLVGLTDEVGLIRTAYQIQFFL